MAHEHLEHVPFGRCEVDDLPVSPHPPVGEVDREVRGHDLGVFLGRRRTPERGRRPRQQLVHPERLRDVVVGPRIERGHLRGFAAPRGQDEDRHLRPPP